MRNFDLQLKNAPIVEAVLDIDCDMPLGFELGKFEAAARELFLASYPIIAQRQYCQQYNIEHRPDEDPEIQSAEPSLHALQFRQKDTKQLVQVRAQGFCFNRLAPYSSLDDYLPEIQRCWELYQGLTNPVLVRAIRLRYINCIFLPCGKDGVELRNYLKTCPKLPDEENLMMTGFFNQHSAVEKDTGHKITIVLASRPIADEKLPVILDIIVADESNIDTDDWPIICNKIQQLRKLKNRIFKDTLEEACLEMFQQ